VKDRILSVLTRLFGYRFDGTLKLANIAEGTHVDSVTKLADAAITTRYLLVKEGTDVDHIATCGADECPVGVCEDEPSAAEMPVNVALFGCAQRTRKMVASEEISSMALVYTAADGKVQDEPAVAGTYYRVGRALTAASTDGDEIEVDPYPPLAFEVS